jgi:hypothetical protein
VRFHHPIHRQSSRIKHARPSDHCAGGFSRAPARRPGSGGLVEVRASGAFSIDRIESKNLGVGVGGWVGGWADLDFEIDYVDRSRPIDWLIDRSLKWSTAWLTDRLPACALDWPWPLAAASDSAAHAGSIRKIELTPRPTTASRITPTTHTPTGEAMPRVRGGGGRWW